MINVDDGCVTDNDVESVNSVGDVEDVLDVDVRL